MSRPTWETTLCNAIQQCLPALHGILPHDLYEDAAQETFRRIFEKILSGKLPVERGTATPLIWVSLRNVAIDMIRPPRCKRETFDRLFRQAVLDGIARDTPEERRQFRDARQADMRRASPRFATSLDQDIQDGSDDGLRRLLGHIMAACMVAANPHSVAALRYNGLPWDAIADLEAHREWGDACRGDLDPQGYASEVEKAKRRYSVERRYWTAATWRQLEPIARKIVGNQPMLLARLEELHDSLKGHRPQ